MFNRNLIILVFAQIFSFTVAPVTVLLSGIIASGMIDIKYIATLPTALTVGWCSYWKCFCRLFNEY